MNSQDRLQFGHPDVWVVDSSALIGIKTVVTVGRQWALLKELEQMVLGGRLAAPRHVYREVSKLRHPDAPGAWAAGVRDSQQLPLEVEPESMRHVLGLVPNLADVSKEDEDADPYVVGLAWQLQQEGLPVRVVTEDTRDRESTSIATACGELGVMPMDVVDSSGPGMS